MENGTFYGNGNILEYDRKGKELVINPEQARTVRKIYEWYLDGWGIRRIQFELEKEGILTVTGKTRWYESNISKILKNSFYAGIIEYNKQFTTDFLVQKKINNFGEINRLRVEDNSEIIEKKKAELGKLETRLNNLISMRADGEIDKEQFRSMKADIDAQMLSLQEQIEKLSPTEQEVEDVPDYPERITVLRYVLERYMNFDSDEDIPEPVIEAFVEKIVVRENSFDWYLLFAGDDNSPKRCNVTGSKKSHKIEVFKESQSLSFVNCNTGCNC